MAHPRVDCQPLVGIYYLVSGATVVRILNLGGWVIPTLIILSFANTVFAYGIWSWKKWGVYGLAADTALIFFVNVISIGFSIFSLTGLIGLGILAYLIRDKWSSFE